MKMENMFWTGVIVATMGVMTLSALINERGTIAFMAFFGLCMMMFAIGAEILPRLKENLTFKKTPKKKKEQIEFPEDE